METETLARLYLEQGHPEKAAPIYERLLAEDPGRASAAEGLKTCRALLRGRRAEESMDVDKRVAVLRRMLARLTGEAVEAPPQAPPSAVAAAAGSPAFHATDPIQRKIELLQSMLQRLTRS